MKSRLKIIVSLLLTVFWGAGLADAVTSRSGQAGTKSEAVVDGELGARLDQYLNRLAAYGFSGAVLVARGDRIVLRKGYGLADSEKGVPTTAATVYDVASITKQFTSAAILKLEMAGKLRADDPVGKYLPDVPDDKKGITLHHLLTHSSGLPFECDGAESMSRDQFVKCMLGAKLDAAPGKQYAYSNGGYGLLAAIIEIVSQQPYETFLRERIFKPAGMEGAGFVGESKWPAELIARGVDDAIDQPPKAPQPVTWQWRGAAGLVVSVGDLYRWESFLRSNRALSPAETEKLFKAHVPTDQPGISYGYGWTVAKTPRGGTLVGHDGITFDGFNSIIQRYVDDGVVVIAASNRFSARFLPMDVIGPAMAAIIFGAGVPLPPDSVSLDPKALEKYHGVYRLPSGAKWVVTGEKDGLLVGAEGQEGVDLLASVDPAKKKDLVAGDDRSTEMLNGVRAGDYGLFGRAFQLPPEQAKEVGGNWIRGLEKKNGPFKGFTILGTIPEPENTRTFVRLEFERGSVIRRMRWDGERLGNIVVGRTPLLPTIFRAQSIAEFTGTEFTGYHVGIGRAVRVRFTLDSKGAANGLLIHTPSGEVRAEKVSD
jgi:CubicO group peptidase (beta-lactamase class C family)